MPIVRPRRVLAKPGIGSRATKISRLRRTTRSSLPPGDNRRPRSTLDRWRRLPDRLVGLRASAGHRPGPTGEPPAGGRHEQGDSEEDRGPDRDRRLVLLNRVEANRDLVAEVDGPKVDPDHR